MAELLAVWLGAKKGVLSVALWVAEMVAKRVEMMVVLLVWWVGQLVAL
jgi:hypothetical protein